MTKPKTKPSTMKKTTAKKAATPKKPSARKAAKTPPRVAKPRPLAYARMKAEKRPTAPGAAFGGGFYAGRQIGPDGKTYALIVAPKETGEKLNIQWKKSNTPTEGAMDLFDGLRNSAALNNADHPAAQFCRSLSIGGFRDWHLPSLEDMALLRRYFMPRFDPNWNPGQTKIDAFKESNAQAFEAGIYWTSTQASAGCAWVQGFDCGTQNCDGKYYRWRVRAVRKIILI
ncbi:MAG: DUF1566 domain-containing protein [Rhodospirillales bacterium]|jgi:hypothetical protein